MNFVKKLIGKVQDYKNNEVVYAEDYNKDFNLLREVINNNAEGVAEAFVELLGLSDSVKKAIEGVITINSVDGSAIVDHTIVYEKLAESTLRKLPNRNEITNLNDNLAKSYYYNETLPANNLHNIFIRHYTEAEQNVATPTTIGFALTKDSFIDASANVLQYINTTEYDKRNYVRMYTYDHPDGPANSYEILYRHYGSGSVQGASNYALLNEAITRVQFNTVAFNDNTLGVAVKTLVLTNNRVYDKDYYGVTKDHAFNCDLTFTITYTDNTQNTVTVAPGVSQTVSVAKNGTAYKQIKNIIAVTPATAIWALTDLHSKLYSYPTVTLNYDSSKLDKVTENQYINNPSDKVYIHVVASETPKTISLIANGATTVLTKQYTEQNVIAGYNEYVYTIDCSESKANAQNFNIKIEMASTDAKVHGYYIAG